MPEVTTTLIAWEDSATWLPEVDRFLNPRLERRTIATWRSRNDLNDLYQDDSEWIEMLESFLLAGFEETCVEFAEHLESFDLRVFHACRPIDVGEYIRGGAAPSCRQSRMAMVSSGAKQRLRKLAAIWLINGNLV
jgi:hypothetical protein